MYRYRGQAPSHSKLRYGSRPVALQLAAAQPTVIQLMRCDPNVGGGLPPMAACQPLMLWLMYRYRGQAPSHGKLRYGSGPVALQLAASQPTVIQLMRCDPNVGGGLPPMAECQPMML
ncbi:hypothetical protein C4J97_2645 [Pseudomonas orientalis]|nr:hypothetical protein C4J97_2645 [Pseudomonas orientalis]